jgi:hypothetical protein
VDGVTQKARRLVWRWYNCLRHESFVPVLTYILFSNKKSDRTVPTKQEDFSRSKSYIDMQPALRDKIPPIVFQTWKSFEVIPENYRIWRGGFAKLNPDWDVILWDDACNREFISRRFPWFLDIYDRYPKEIFRADAIRPFFLFLFGGIYADMDSECVTSLDGFAAQGGVVLGQMGADPDFEHAVPNALMASQPFELFWLLYITMMVEDFEHLGEADINPLKPEDHTGPILLKRAVDYFQTHDRAEVRQRCARTIAQLPPAWAEMIASSDLRILANGEMYGVDWTNPLHRILRKMINKRKIVVNVADVRRMFPQAQLITYWSHSW